MIKIRGPRGNQQQNAPDAEVISNDEQSALGIMNNVRPREFSIDLRLLGVIAHGFPPHHRAHYHIDNDVKPSADADI